MKAPSAVILHIKHKYFIYSAYVTYSATVVNSLSKVSFIYLTSKPKDIQLSVEKSD